MTSPDIDYVVVSNIIVDDIVLANGEQRLGVLGGAATYAAAGACIWSEKVGIVSGVGHDFDDDTRVWFSRNGIDLQGTIARHEHTPRAWVRYFHDGEREEAPQFGSEHFQLMEPSPADLPAFYAHARGLYIFRSHDVRFWQAFQQLERVEGRTTLWEISATSTQPEHLPSIVQILPMVDILSINQTEAFSLFQTQRPQTVLIRALEAGAKVVVLRLGDQGSLATDGMNVVRVPAAPAVVCDVTGGGNAFSGGFLVGYCESDGDLTTGGRYGAVSAAMVIEQYGPPPRIDLSLRSLAQERASLLDVDCLSL